MAVREKRRKTTDPVVVGGLVSKGGKVDGGGRIEDGGDGRGEGSGRTEDELLERREDVDAICHLHLVDLQ